MARLCLHRASRPADPEIGVTRGAREHVPQANAPLGDDRQTRIDEVTVIRLLARTTIYALITTLF